MELTVAKKDLLKLVTRMQGVAERKSTMPVLSNVLLAVDGPGALRLAATDLYLAISGRVNAEISKGGTVAVPAKDLLERVKMMPDGPVHIATQENSTTTLKAAGSARRYTLRGMPGTTFPPCPFPGRAHRRSLSRSRCSRSSYRRPIFRSRRTRLVPISTPLSSSGRGTSFGW